jgi:glycosyltransferase involved in cell wall biosynthesis
VHLTALVEGREHVCCRYRLAAFRPFFERAGHTLTLQPLPRGWWARLWLFRRLEGANLILQRRLLPGWQLAALRRNARLLLFDFDDAVFCRDSYSPKGVAHPGRMRRFAAAVRASDAVVAGNAYLRTQAARWTEGRRVHAVPTCVDTARYPLADHRRGGAGVELVWVGSVSTLQGMRFCAPLLEEVGARVPGLRLKLVCDRFLELRNLPVLACPWDEGTEGRDIAAADIGISWLPDDDWSRGKCGLKVLQYMASGLPVVANPVGVQAELVRHGETGFLAATPDEWAEAVGRLARDPGLRRRMGWAARRVVESRYSVPVGALLWRGVLDRLGEQLARAG